MPAFRTEWDTEPNPVYDIWTAVNGSEVVPGIVSPLFATSFVHYDYEGLRRLMASYAGGHRAELFPPPVANFFGVFGGRLALNNGFSVAAVSALDPEIAQAILGQFFTGATGGERFIVDSTPEEREVAYREATAQREAAPAVLAGYRAALFAERSSSRYERDLNLDLPAAWERWQQLCDENFTVLLPVHYVVSVAAGEFQVRLAGVIQAGGGDPNVMVALCSAIGEVESSKPAMALYDLAEQARADGTVRAAFEAGDLDDIASHLEDTDGPWAAFAEAYRDFRFRYGYRGQGEVDPTNPDWAEQPTFALSQERAMIDVPPEASPRTTTAEAVARRQALEADVRAALPDELRPVFDDVLARAQAFTRMRELSKATWVLGARRTRAAYLALGRGLAEAGVVDDADDARFLFADEVSTVVGGGSLPDARDRVARRRARADEAEGYLLPDNWVGESVPEPRGEAVDVDRLEGLGVSPGRGPVTGTARIIPSAVAGLARDLDPGDVLVAPFTDAPWTPLFITAGAVVVETGGVLSHAATVAREFGIPAVVMVKQATQVIKEGDEVTVDGMAGTVTILTRA